MKVYRSAISWLLLLWIAVPLLSVSVIMIWHEVWPGLAVCIACAGFIVYLFRNTYYQLDDELLVVKGGFLVNEKIKIADIRTIKETNNPISSPALSLDRLEIAYKKFDRILISPKDKAGFIAELQQLNPEIRFFPKK